MPRDPPVMTATLFWRFSSTVIGVGLYGLSFHIPTGGRDRYPDHIAAVGIPRRCAEAQVARNVSYDYFLAAALTNAFSSACEGASSSMPRSGCHCTPRTK